jgi:EAL domain-containing protein (putative c-di-GMP-specific phosphodiesterase class I)
MIRENGFEVLVSDFGALWLSIKKLQDFKSNTYFFFWDFSSYCH